MCAMVPDLPLCWRRAAASPASALVATATASSGNTAACASSSGTAEATTTALWALYSQGPYRA